MRVHTINYVIRSTHPLDRMPTFESSLQKQPTLHLALDGHG